MIALQIQDTKNFMSKLLLGTTFDRFYLVEGSISTFGTFHIDGHLHTDYFSKEEQEEYHLSSRSFSYWQEVKGFCLELIKGKKTPLGFSFTFQLSKSNTEKLLSSSGISEIHPENIQGLLLNLKYDGNTVSCITATSLNFFTMDKSLDHAWDNFVERFFRQQEISFL